ncbi:hypothetical protein [Escherichia phage M01]|nr:hypothetical protein [Escherichia phage M01]
MLYISIVIAMSVIQNNGVCRTQGSIPGKRGPSVQGKQGPTVG